ncbi:hypothetical protein EZS27_034939 [termite gut metagenome]|uniref:Uncharacterized protein n=1 Tax=termite gut metagenome TaxID=433724 RepID=A0A5J4PXN6_9ZZZZ
MKKRLILLVSILLTTVTATFSQELRLVVHNKPLNTVLSSSKLLMLFSQFSTGNDNLSGITNNQPISLDIIHIDNSIQEYSFNLVHMLNVEQHQKLQIGEWQQYSGSLDDSRSQISNPAVYVTDNISLGKLFLQAGVRADFILNDKVYI